MEITQIQLSYIELQDRIIARINLGADRHVALTLTRRICKFMIENLASFLKIDLPKTNTNVQIDNDFSAQRKSEFIDLNEIDKPVLPEDPVESAHASLPPGVQRDLPFEERGPEGSLLEKGHESVLVLNAGCVRSDEGLTFTFMIEGAQPLNLNLSSALATAIYQLLIDVAKRTQWFDGLGPKLEVNSTQAAMPSEEEKKSITYH